MISYMNDQKSFLQKLNQNTNLVQGRFLDFLSNITNALKEKKLVEFLWFNMPENTDIIYIGTLVDIYASDSILSKKQPFLIFELNVNGESILIQSPPINENTIECNDNNLNKYYLLDDLMHKYSNRKLDPRFTITIKK